MHELSLCEAIATNVTSRAQGRHVTRVVVRVGHLRQVVPETLTFCWQVLTADTPLDGSNLEVEHIPAVVACDVCDVETTLDLPILACAKCGTADVNLVSGEELMLVSLDVSEGA